jgi:hypothetical protein
MPALVELGPDLVVLEDLDIVTAPKIQRIGPRSRIGGNTMVAANNASGWTINQRSMPKGSWESGVGIRAGLKDVVSNRYGRVEFENGYLTNPVQFPPSMYGILFGLV